MPNRMNIELHLDSEDNSICKTIGNLSNSVRAACFKGNWEKDEQLIGDEIQEKVSVKLHAITYGAYKFHI